MEQQSKFKYYTPKDEELYIGYICRTSLPEMYPGDGGIIPVDNILDAVSIKAFSEGDIDVETKYLDQSDIESLGWEFDKSRGIPLEYHYTKEVNLKKYKLTKLSTKIHIGILQQGNTLYEGECKSINELRKIMEWLNIK